MDYTEEEIATLTPAEQAAMTEGDAADAEALAAIGADDAGDGGNENAANAGAETAPVIKAEAPIEKAEVVVPTYRAEPVADYAAKIAAFNTEKAALFQKVMDGDLDAAEYAKQEADISAKRDELQSQQMRATISAEMTQQASANAWESAVTDFMQSTALGEGIDYAESTTLNQALDKEVRALAGLPENAERTGAWILQQAHAKVLASTDAKVSKLVSTYQTAHEAVKQVNSSKSKQDVQSRQPDLSKLPPTLGNLPAAKTGDVNAGEFAHLDNMSGQELENAIAAMNSAQRDRYAMA